MINHPQKGIFNPVRTEPLTGRNANIQPTMFKRRQIFERTPNQRFETPFSGYSFTGSSVTDNSLARSQVSQFSQQNVIRLIKQQLQKNGINSISETSQESLKNKNQLNILRIQIRSIKESYHELNKSFKKKIQEQNDTIAELKKQIVSQAKDNTLSRDDMSSQLVQKIKQVEQDIAIKMRLIFGKMQEDLRKELTNYANRQFVPTSFLDDLDKQLNQLDDRIANIQSEYEASKNKGNKQSFNTSKIDKDSSVILSSGSELKLKQFERDLINLKKQLDEKSDKIKEIDESMMSKNQSFQKELKQIKQTVIQVNTGIKERQKENEIFQSNMEAKIQSDKKKLFQQLETKFEEITKRIDQQLVLKSLTLSNSIAPNRSSIKNQSTSILLDNNEALSESGKFQETRDESKISAFSISNGAQNVDNNPLNKKTQAQANNSSSIIVSANDSTISNKDSPKRTKKITITYGTTEKTPSQIIQNNNNIQQKTTIQPANQPKIVTQNKQQVKNFYKVDKEGYLMDWNNKYILSPSNSMIFVSEKQIQTMEKSSLIKIQRWKENNKTEN